MKKNKIPWHQGTIAYSLFFGILALICLVGSYILYQFRNTFVTFIYLAAAIVFLILSLYWLYLEKKGK